MKHYLVYWAEKKNNKIHLYRQLIQASSKNEARDIAKDFVEANHKYNGKTPHMFWVKVTVATKNEIAAFAENLVKCEEIL